MTFSLAHCELVTLLVTVGQLQPRLAAFDNVCQVQTTKEFLRLYLCTLATTQPDQPLALKIDQNRERFRDRTFCRAIRASHPQVHDVERLQSEVLQIVLHRFLEVVRRESGIP